MKINQAVHNGRGNRRHWALFILGIALLSWNGCKTRDKSWIKISYDEYSDLKKAADKKNKSDGVEDLSVDSERSGVVDAESEDSQSTLLATDGPRSKASRNRKDSRNSDASNPNGSVDSAISSFLFKRDNGCSCDAFASGHSKWASVLKDGGGALFKGIESLKDEKGQVVCSSNMIVQFKVEDREQMEREVQDIFECSFSISKIESVKIGGRLILSHQQPQDREETGEVSLNVRKKIEISQLKTIDLGYENLRRRYFDAGAGCGELNSECLALLLDEGIVSSEGRSLLVETFLQKTREPIQQLLEDAPARTKLEDLNYFKQMNLRFGLVFHTDQGEEVELFGTGEGERGVFFPVAPWKVSEDDDLQVRLQELQSIFDLLDLHR